MNPDELRREQGYADWVQSLIERELVIVGDLINSAATPAERRALERLERSRKKALEDGRDEILIGRLDTESEETLYIGKTLVECGGSDVPAVINWRAPIAELFYQASKADPNGVGRRRTLVMRSRRVTKYSDDTLIRGFKPLERGLTVPPPPAGSQTTSRGQAASSGNGRRVPEPGHRAPDPGPSEEARSLLDAAAQVPNGPGLPHPIETPAPEVSEGELRAEDILLDELNASRSGAMGEIVATIQADQDRLIRSDAHRALVIQGGPGTGKTVVALHRAAWVLYTQRDTGTGEPSALVVGPNATFLDYIRGVLPALGESDTAQYAIDDLARTGLNADERRGTRPTRVASYSEARLKGDLRMSAVIKHSVWRHILPTKFEVGFGRYLLRVTAEEVTEALESLWHRNVPYRDVRTELRERILGLLAQNLVQRAGQQRVSADELDSLARRTRQQLVEAGWLETVVPALTPRQSILRLFSDSEHRDACTPGFTADERNLLASPSQRRYRWSSPDAALLDEAAAVLKGTPARFGHVIIDEAQDLSPMQWRVIRRRSSRGMTIAGDLAQATTAWSPSSWDEVAERAALEDDSVYSELRLGYRVPEPVMAYAGRLLPVAAPRTDLPRSFRTGNPPLVRRTSRTELRDAVLEEVERGASSSGTVAVICAPQAVKGIRSAIGDHRQNVTVVEDESAKGLEFDKVVVVEPQDVVRWDEDDTRGLRRLYICLTRCTKELVIAHSKPLPAALALPLVEGGSIREQIRHDRLQELVAEVGIRAATLAVYPRSYQRWSEEEIEALRRRVGAGLSLDEIAELHQRRSTSVLDRIRKLGLPRPRSQEKERAE